MKISSELVVLLQKKESTAQQQFWQTYFAPMCGICSKILGPGPDAVDIATDLLNDFIFHYVHKLTNLDGAWTYLKLMAVRRSVRARQQANKNDQFDEQQNGPPLHNMHQIEFQSYLPTLANCLETLTPKAQSSIRLKFVKGLSNEQIGILLGGSKQYIGKLLQKSLILLKNCIHQKEVTHVQV